MPSDEPHGLRTTPESVQRSVSARREWHLRSLAPRRTQVWALCREQAQPGLESVAIEGALSLWCADLVRIAPQLLKDFIEIGKSAASKLQTPLADWAYTQARQLLIDEEFRELVKSLMFAADGLVFATPAIAQAAEQVWCCPKWLGMEPLGDAPYDGVTARERHDRTKTEKLLASVRMKFEAPIDSKLRQTREFFIIREPDTSRVHSKMATGRPPDLARRAAIDEAVRIIRHDRKRGNNPTTIRLAEVLTTGGFGLSETLKKDGFKDWNEVVKDPQAKGTFNAMISEARKLARPTD